MSLPSEVYTSLLQTVAVLPKKKHFKKIVNYMLKHENVENIPSHVINQIIDVGIANQYPMTLG
jgi:hypothetical protein